MAAPKGNKFALGLTETGAPPKYETKEEMCTKINEYFDSLWDDETQVYSTRPTMTGLALYLGFASRQSLYDYAKKEDFSYIITRAKQTIAMSYEELLNSKHSNGAIFALKNMGWDDKSIIEQTNIKPPKIKFTTRKKK